MLLEIFILELISFDSNNVIEYFVNIYSSLFKKLFYEYV